MATRKLKLKLIAQQWYPIWLAYALQCRGLLKRGHVDVCCIQWKVTDCNPPPLVSSNPIPSPFLDPALVCSGVSFFHTGMILNVVGWISTPGWRLYRCLHVSLHLIQLEVRVRMGLVMEKKHNTLVFFYCPYTARTIACCRSIFPFRYTPAASFTFRYYLIHAFYSPLLWVWVKREKGQRAEEQKVFLERNTMHKFRLHLLPPKMLIKHFSMWQAPLNCHTLACLCSKDLLEYLQQHLHATRRWHCGCLVFPSIPSEYPSIHWCIIYYIVHY